MVRIQQIGLATAAVFLAGCMGTGGSSSRLKDTPSEEARVQSIILSNLPESEIDRIKTEAIEAVNWPSDSSVSVHPVSGQIISMERGSGTAASSFPTKIKAFKDMFQKLAFKMGVHQTNLEEGGVKTIANHLKYELSSLPVGQFLVGSTKTPLSDRSLDDVTSYELDIAALFPDNSTTISSVIVRHEPRYPDSSDPRMKNLWLSNAPFHWADASFQDSFTNRTIKFENSERSFTGFSDFQSIMTQAPTPEFKMVGLPGEYNNDTGFYNKYWLGTGWQFSVKEQDVEYNLFFDVQTGNLLSIARKEGVFD